MRKYAVTIVPFKSGYASLNPAVNTYSTDGSDDPADTAARIVALYVCLATRDAISKMAVTQVTRSTGSGPATLIFPTRGQVNTYIDAINDAIGGSNIDTFPNPNESPYEAAVGQTENLQPLGTSICVTETALAGPRGRTYLPFASPSVNDGVGSMTPEIAGNIRTIMAAWAGFFAGTPDLPKIFGVQSASGFSLWTALKVSTNLSHLKSRTR